MCAHAHATRPFVYSCGLKFAGVAARVNILDCCRAHLDRCIQSIGNVGLSGLSLSVSPSLPPSPSEKPQTIFRFPCQSQTCCVFLRLSFSARALAAVLCASVKCGVTKWNGSNSQCQPRTLERHVTQTTSALYHRQ